MNYKEKYENLIHSLESIVKAFNDMPLIENENVSQELLSSIEEILEQQNEIEMPSGAEIVKGEAFIYASEEDLAEGKMMKMAKENLQSLLTHEKF